MGDWVIEEFDSERNILLPWWWTRGDNARIQQQQRVSGKKRRLIINRDEQGDNICNRIFSEHFELFKSPLQGSFFTRNSSRAIQPPPTRTITVLRKIRTRRSCWESPNYGGERERVRHVDHHSVNVKVGKKSYANKEIKLGLWILVIHATTKHTDSLCKRVISFPCHTDLHKEDYNTWTHSQVSFPTTQITLRSIQLVYFWHAGADRGADLSRTEGHTQ